MDIFLKFFIAYWIIGLLVVLFSLANDDIKTGFKDDTFAYVVAAIAISLLYPIALISKHFAERSKTKDESRRDI